EFQLERFSAEREAAQLVAETNAEYRNAPDELANIFHGIIHWLGIAWTVGQKYAVGGHAKDFVCGGLRRYHSHFAVMIHEQAQDILLDAEIVRDDSKGARFAAGSRF